MTILGALFLPSNPPERLRSVALAADEAGLDELWLWEDCFLESGIASTAAALGWTQRLRVSVGLLPVPLRNVALTAMEAATLLRLFPDRVNLAIGHGVQRWMEQVGERVESPMTLLREYAVALRSLLDGERVTTTGRYVRLNEVELEWPPTSRPTILVGAVGPKTLRLAGEVGDGTVLTGGTTPDAVRAARQTLGAGPSIVVYLSATGDAPTVAAEVRRFAEAGADSIVLQPSADEPDPEGFVRFVATEVRPLVP